MNDSPKKEKSFINEMKNYSPNIINNTKPHSPVNNNGHIRGNKLHRW